MFPPTTSDFGEHGCAIFRHVVDQSARGPGLLVSRAPDEQLQKYRRQVDSFLRQSIVHPPAVGLFGLLGDDPSGLQPLQAVGQNVGGDALTRAPKLLEGPVSANHKVADDQQRPPVSKPLQRETDGTAGARLGQRLPRHGGQDINITCITQVTGANCYFLGKNGSCECCFGGRGR